MARLVIQGGKKLTGEVTVAGMKNAATPIFAATLLASGPCTIRNVPRLTDVDRMLLLLEHLGASVEWAEPHTVRIDPRQVSIAPLLEAMEGDGCGTGPLAKAIKAMRSSVLLLGPLLARFPEMAFSEPGGCIIGNRPLSTHLRALEALGVEVSASRGCYHFRRRELLGARVVLPEFSVTATENLIMAATAARGITEIHLAAAEPHVEDLVRFLRALGANITGEGTHTIRIEGGHPLGAAEHTLIADQIEVGTFAVAAAATHGDVRILGCVPQHLDSILSRLSAAGVQSAWESSALHILPSSQLKAFRLQALPYPGFPTDLQAPFAVLATQCQGTSLIHDPLFEARMGYVGELVKMGANATVCDPHRVLISGPTPLYGSEIRSLDLRQGATLVIAALVAQGTSVIYDAEVLDRGYEQLAQRLQKLGAAIERQP